MENKYWFDREKLKVYRTSVEFAAWLSSLLEGAPKPAGVKDQLDRASTSIPLNIAEGNGKYTMKDRCRFFDIARGSALDAQPDWMFSRRKEDCRKSKLRLGRNSSSRS